MSRLGSRVVFTYRKVWPVNTGELSVSFRSSIGPFLDGLSPQNKRLALGAVGAYILLGDYKSYRDRVTTLPSSFSPLFNQDVLRYIKSSFECRNIWRSVYYGLTEGDILDDVESQVRVASRFNVDPSGVRIVWGSLYPEDRERVVSKAQEGVSLGSLTAEEMEELVRVLSHYCKSVAYRKLRFVSDNDCAYDLDDMQDELLSKGLQTVRAYEHTRDLLKIRNYAMRTIKNHAINLIHHYTSESRACVKNITRGCGTCLYCLTDRPQRCPDSVAVYCSTATSLDSSPFLAELLASGADVERSSRDRALLNCLTEGVSSDQKHLIDVVFGDLVDPVFETWLRRGHSLTVDYLMNHPKRFVKVMCGYLGIDPKETFTCLSARYSNYLKAA